jgi:hypothetical protein
MLLMLCLEKSLSFALMPRQILRGADADAMRLARHHSPFAPILTLKDKEGSAAWFIPFHSIIFVISRVFIWLSM